jgi:hypothetical protein
MPILEKNPQLKSWGFFVFILIVCLPIALRYIGMTQL